MAYSMEQFEQDVRAIRPRPFDTYVLPAFLIFVAVRSGKRPLPKLARRMLFTSGVYMLYRNYAQYKQAYQVLVSSLQAEEGENG